MRYSSNLICGVLHVWGTIITSCVGCSNKFMYEVIAVRMMRWPTVCSIIQNSKSKVHRLGHSVNFPNRLDRFVSMRPNLMGQRNASALNSGKFSTRINCVLPPLFKFTIHHSSCNSTLYILSY